MIYHTLICSAALQQGVDIVIIIAGTGQQTTHRFKDNKQNTKTTDSMEKGALVRPVSVPNTACVELRRSLSRLHLTANLKTCLCHSNVNTDTSYTSKILNTKRPIIVVFLV